VKTKSAHKVIMINGLMKKVGRKKWNNIKLPVKQIEKLLIFTICHNWWITFKCFSHLLTVVF